MKREAKVGLTVLAALLGVYLMVTWAKSTHLFSASRKQYQIKFSEISGLKVGDPVMVFGYPSGNVTSISLQSDGALVEIGVDASVPVNTDAIATIMMKELMGGKQISIQPGKMGSPLASGGTIQGITTMDVSHFFAKAGSFLETFEPEKLDSLIYHLNELAISFGDLGKQMGERDMGKLVDDITGSADRLHHILEQVENRRIVSKLDSAFAKLNTLAGKGEKTMESVTALSDRVNSVTLPQAEALLKDISKTMDEAEGLMVEAKNIITQMKDKQTVLGKVVYDKAFATEMEHTIANLNETLDFFRQKKVHVALSLSNKQAEFGEESGGKKVKGKTP